MVPLPVIVGFGGINAAGRSSFHHAYRRLVIDSLPKERARQAWSALAATMNISCDASGPNDEQIANMRAHTLIRRIEGEYFDVDRTHVHLRARIQDDDTHLNLAKNQPLLSDVPAAWKTSNADDKGDMVLRVAAGEEVMLPHYTPLPARGAGQLPSGCVLGGYGSKHHPRGLEMSVYALSDALNSLGLDWDTLRKRVPPEQISVYSASAMGQLDKNGTGGLLRAHLLGERTSARNCPLGLAEMPADFSNAYVLGNMGNTGGVVGACATLLYNLRAAVHDIRRGDAQIAVVGASEAPIVPEVLASYIAMGALATDESLRKLDGIDGEPDWRTACRPFAENCGFTIAESSQYFILFSDALALETGAHIYGSVADVYTNADGYKKSISSPGVGNYLTVARAMATVKAVLGQSGLESSYVLAHGTGTPQNRVTESHVLDENAKWFGLSAWRVAAIKCYLGHSVATASGDQLAVALGVWEEGFIPGISTMREPAADVHHQRLSLSNKDVEVASDELDVAFINSKGFGGNNATGAVFSPQCTENLLHKRHGKGAMKQWRARSVAVTECAMEADARALNGNIDFHYSFGDHVYDGTSLKHTHAGLQLPDGQPPISLDIASPYPDLKH